MLFRVRVCQLVGIYNRSFLYSDGRLELILEMSHVANLKYVWLVVWKWVYGIGYLVESCFCTGKRTPILSNLTRISQEFNLNRGYTPLGFNSYVYPNNAHT